MENKKIDWRIPTCIEIQPILGARALRAIELETKQFIEDSKIGVQGWKVKK